MEIWKEILGWEGLYQASSEGRIRRMPYERILKPALKPNGYLYVTLSKDAKQAYKLVHRLVLEAFAGSTPIKIDCAHLDGNRVNNRVENLVWATRKENASHKWAHGTMPVGETHHNARLKAADIREIRSMLGYGLSYYKISKRFSVSPATIRDIDTGRTWQETA